MHQKMIFLRGKIVNSLFFETIFKICKHDAYCYGLKEHTTYQLETTYVSGNGFPSWPCE